MIKWFNWIELGSTKMESIPLPANKTLIYRLTDPLGNPPLLKEEDMVEQVAPFFRVAGFVGGGYTLETPQGQAASVYMNIDKAIRNYNTFAENPVSQWAACRVLMVSPRAGRKINAFYNRTTLSFFFDKDVVTNSEVFVADSPDVVVHELGHAILDQKRPDFWDTANLEIAALHEFWGDEFSIISQLQHPEVAQAILQLTNGDIRVPNVVSSLAEQMGKTVYDDFHLAGANPLWLRSAVNKFKYVSIKSVSQDAPADHLSANPHSFARILTGAMYDLMVVIYETEKSAGKDALTALLDAAKGLGWYIDRAMTRTPNTTDCFPAFAETLLMVDRDLSQSYYQQKFQQVLKNRQLVSDVKLLARREPAGLIEVRLCDVLPTPPVSALDYNPLYKVQVQIPDEGIISALAARQFVDYLDKHGQVSPSPDTPFEVLNGKLVRSHIDSEDYFPNWLNPTQPEFYRPPKPQNNFQPCGCKEQLEKEEILETRRIVREANTRYRVIS